MRNHYVPEFYFGPWVDGNKHLFQFSRRKTGVVADKKTPGQICYVPDLHTLTGAVPPETKHYVESWLTSEIDTRAAPVIAKILSDGMGSLSPEEGSYLIRFIQALIVRRPEAIQRLKEETAPLLLHNLSAVERLGWPELSSSLAETGLTLREHIEREHPQLIENAGQLMIGQIIAHAKTGEKLFRLEWVGVDLAGTSIVPIVTSDRAVVALGQGPDDPEAIMILPLSPAYIVVGAATNTMAKLKALGKGRLGLFAARAIVNDARRYVYGTEHSNMALIQRYLK